MGAMVLLILLLFGLAFLVIAAFGGFFAFLFWNRWKDREARALDFVLLQIAVPKDNEIKIDAMEQMISSFHALGKAGGMFSTTGGFMLVRTGVAGQKEGLRTTTSVLMTAAVPSEMHISKGVVMRGLSVIVVRSRI